MARTTPGPWRYVDQGYEYAHVVRGDCDSRAYDVCTTWTVGGDAHANARLIAQAPDMAALIASMVEHLRRHDPDELSAIQRSLMQRGADILRDAGCDVPFETQHQQEDDDEQPIEEPSGPDDLSDDAEVLRSAGFGTDEDYGCFGENW